MERRKLARNVATLVLSALLGTAWQTGLAWEDLRGGPGIRPYGPGWPPGPAGPPAAARVSVGISNPGVSAIETSDASMLLQGWASSVAGVAGVSWRSSSGASGAASGTVNWGTGYIPLELGRNEITVTAYDHAGNAGSDTIVIHRESTERQSVTLSWVAPTRRVNGSPLTDLAGYEIHYGRMSKTYDYRITIDNPGVSTYVVPNLGPGDWYFTMTALDRDGNASDFSNEARRTLH